MKTSCSYLGVWTLDRASVAIPPYSASLRVGTPARFVEFRRNRTKKWKHHIPKYLLLLSSGLLSR